MSSLRWDSYENFREVINSNRSGRGIEKIKNVIQVVKICFNQLQKIHQDKLHDHIPFKYSNIVYSTYQEPY